MYRPPENSNRVKSIKNKFEQGENKSTFNKKNGTRSDLSETGIKSSNDASRQNVSRQLSDPARRNIKRTPAFRIDTNTERKENSFQRNASYNRSYYFEKIQQFNSALKSNCDSNKNVINRTENAHNKLDANNVQQATKDNARPVLIKSKSSHDFAYIRSKFDRKTQENQMSTPESNQRKNDVTSTSVNKSSLYTEPVPKALRNKNLTKPEDVKSEEEISSDQIHSANTLKICDVKLVNFLSENLRPAPTALTDTLKAALNRPLPKGPAPQKPPRTFEHSPVKESSEAQKNTSFLHHRLHKQQGDVKKGGGAKHDPRYMLNKLENALRNNRIKTRRARKCEATTTSGEDSDDSVLFKSKSQRELPSIPNTPASSPSTFNFNCLNGLTSCKTTYETVKEPNSSFFVSCESEPVYAEPFNFSQDDDGAKDNADGKSKTGEKSLYYMSTPLLRDDKKSCSNMDENLNQLDTNEASPNFKDTFRKQLSPGSSSQSSFTSDIDSALSTPLDENKSFETSVRIKQLISTFETRQAAGLPKSESHLPPDRFQGIEEVKMSLQKTMEKCFSQEATKDSSDELDQRERKVSVDTIINKFQTYIKTMPKYEKPLVNRDDRLFYCCLVVGWDCEKPQIKLKFPPNAKIPDRMEDLCYPEAASGPLDISDNAQCYSLVITNDKGERTFGYCRRVIPEGSTRCIPLAYCILSKHRAPRFYKKILAELESRHGIPDKLRDELIAAFYNNKFPRPGESIKINLADVIGDSNCARPRHRDCDLPDLRSFVHVNFNGGYGTLNGIRKTSDYENMVMCRSWPLIVEDDGNTELLLTLHHDTRYEEADLKPLHQLPADILLKIFASLLLERKVVLISCVISKLSCCVDALQSILYPFSWPHTFIPILPQCLWDVVESPTPVICGILSVSVVNDHKIEHGIVVDLDEGTIVCEEGDEDNILSDSMKKSWRQGIRLAERESPDRYVHSVYLSDAYLKVFIDSLKHYKNHINGNNFEKESFIRGGRTKGIRRFLKWFTETTMFLSFIDSVTTNPESFTLFDQKIEMYGSDESNLIVTKLLEWKK